MNGCSLQAIYRFDIATKVPLHGDISYVDLAKLCQIHERDLRRILRFSIAFHRIFRESKKGFVAHTAASRQLTENPDLRDTLGMWYEDCWPSMVQVRRARRSYSRHLSLETANPFPIYPKDTRCHTALPQPAAEPNGM